MKRLFYSTNNLDDAESISDEVHSMGIDDHHFYVISQDQQGINTHHLHGSNTLEGTHILAAERRANWVASAAAFIIGGGIGLGLGWITPGMVMTAAVVGVVFMASRFFASIAGSSFNEYIKGVFNAHLKKGEVIVIIDVDREQSDRVVAQMKHHPAANFLADSSNLASPIPD